MSTLRPGFSERVFEFAFNAEYADLQRAVLAAAPSIPTQNEEKVLGYDVLFQITAKGGAVHAVALQHKVARHVDRRASTNHHFWEAIGGPYFRFSLDTDQYNLIQSISATKPAGAEFHFCAPLFVTHSHMNAHYLRRTVEANSIWIDVGSAGQITDGGTHSIVYSEDGKKAFRFSNEATPLQVLDREQRAVRRTQRQEARLDNVEEIYKIALKTVEEYWPKRRRRRGQDEARSLSLPQQPPKKEQANLASLAKLLSAYYGLSVLVEVRK
jgi:hypothetical protein